MLGKKNKKNKKMADRSAGKSQKKGNFEKRENAIIVKTFYFGADAGYIYLQVRLVKVGNC